MKKINKNTVRLTETQLHQIIKETVNLIIEGQREKAALMQLKHSGGNFGNTEPITTKSIWNPNQTMTQQLQQERDIIQSKQSQTNQKKEQILKNKIEKLINKLPCEINNVQKKLITQEIMKLPYETIMSSKGRFLPYWFRNILDKLKIEY